MAQIFTRKQRGDKIKPEDLEQLNAQSFFVRSQTGKSGYSVTRAGQGWSCDCPDLRYRRIKCKHIHAVESQISKLPVRLGLWEPQK